MFSPGRPQQPVVYVHPGETALAFYTARNPTDKYVYKMLEKKYIFIIILSIL